jgi:FKBP-type peptidyl-prolyl cis-trans isomerase 2
MAESTPSTASIVVVIVLVLIGGGAAAGYVYLSHRPVAGPTPILTVVGDNVTVNYIGVFGSGPEQGKVFDTSLYPVASNGALWPKSLGFQSRGGPGNYSPLAVHVGPSTPSGGYSVGGKSYIQVVTGFWQGLLGLPGNLTKSVTVPPALGYGAENPACLLTKSLVDRFPIVSSLTRTQFGAAYAGIIPNTGATFTDPHYGWTVLILSANATAVSIERLASVGNTASPAGWTVVVTNVTSTPNGSGQITVLNELGPAQAGLLQGNDFAGNGPCSSRANGKFIVSAVDPVAGTYTEDFNSEVTGKTLIFLVTIVAVHPPVVVH